MTSHWFLHNYGCLFTRKFLGQVHVVILFREVHPVLCWAPQTTVGEDGHCNVCVLLAGGGMLLDEYQVADHHCLRLGLWWKGVNKRKRGGKVISIVIYNIFL